MTARFAFLSPVVVVLALCGNLLAFPSPASGGMHPDRIAVAAAGARVRLVTAVETVLREMNGARFLSAAMIERGSGFAYDVRLLVGDTMRSAVVDAAGGAIVEVTDIVPDMEAAAELESMRSGLESVHISPLQAIEAALGRVPDARPVAVEFAMDASMPVYRLELVTANRVMMITLDGLTAQPYTRQQDAGQPAEPKPAAEKAKAPSGAKVWNFDKDEAGKAPAGWKFGETGSTEPAGKWQVVKDDGAASKPHVFSLVAGAGADGAYSVAMATDSSAKDLELSVRVRANSGKVDQGGGLVWRCKDENNYYICRYNPLESNYRVYKVVDGKRTQLATAKVEAAAEKWYTVRVAMKGADIVCWLDDQKLLEAKDDTFPDAGMIGVWTKADALTSFDDLTLAAP